MRVAFKEWAIVVDALGRGEQIIILRKGGISEGSGGFKVEHSEFLLAPTLFHQQRESVIASAQRRYDQISAEFAKPDRLRIGCGATVVEWKELTSIESLQALQGQHIWRDEVLSERFEWGRANRIYALVLRVFRIPHVRELAVLPSYGGCKSWIELAEEISTEGAEPVLSRSEFEQKLAKFRAGSEEAVRLPANRR
jgi:hypothetical protein